VHIEGTSTYGRPPGAGAKVEICLDGDNPRMTRTDAGYTLGLLGSSDGFKENVSIVTPTELLTEDTSEAVGAWQDVRVPSSIVFNLNKHLQGENGIVYTSDFQIDMLGLNAKTIKTSTGEETEGILTETASGIIPPMYGDTHVSHFKLIEYRAGETTPIPEGHADRAYKKDSSDPDSHVADDGYVPFINGSNEFVGSNSQWQFRRWTFDPYSGNLHFASHPIERLRTFDGSAWLPALPSRNRIVFRFRRRLFKVLEESEWNYYRNTVTGKTDTSKIVVEPTAVRQFEISIPVEADANRVFLLEDTHTDTTQLGMQFNRSHSFWKKRIVKGSLKFGDSDNVLSGIQPVEMPFVDGETELQNTRQAQYLVSAQTGAGIKTFTIPNLSATSPLVGDVLFDPLPAYPDAIHSSQFVNEVDTVLLVVAAGDYHVDDTTGVVTVKIDTGDNLKAYRAIYRYEDLTSGIIKEGLFSVDYDEGVLYFNEGATVLADSVTFNITMYSAFYNLGEIVSDRNIEKIDEEAQIVELKPAFGARFLADSTSGNPVPRFLRVGYEYYEASTESLKDLEPYFSPISKDLAIRAISKDMIGDI
jgi:hypothetical protein